MTLPFAAATAQQTNPLQAKYIALVAEIESPLALNGFKKTQKAMALFAEMILDKVSMTSLHNFTDISLLTVPSLVAICQGTDGAYFSPSEDGKSIEIKNSQKDSSEAWTKFLIFLAVENLDSVRHPSITQDGALIEKRLG